MAKPLKVKIEMLMDEEEQKQRKEVHDSIPLPELAKDAYIYRIGMDAHLRQLKAIRMVEEAK